MAMYRVISNWKENGGIGDEGYPIIPSNYIYSTVPLAKAAVEKRARKIAKEMRWTLQGAFIWNGWKLKHEWFKAEIDELVLDKV